MGRKAAALRLLHKAISNILAIRCTLGALHISQSHHRKTKRSLLISPNLPIKRPFVVRFFNIIYRSFVFAPLISLIAMNVAAGKDSRKEIPLHHFKLSCFSCHEPQSADTNQPLRDRGNVGQVKGDINRLCSALGCHNFDSLLNHPVGIKPKTTIPKNMPLDRHSRITCLTCHDRPKSSGTLRDIDGGPKRLLRKPAGIQFCSTCHMKIGGSMLEQSHWRFSSRAHLGSINTQTHQSENSERFIGGIDTESRMCLSCHENITVTIPADSETPNQKWVRRKGQKDHPIGMDYGRTALRKIGRYKFPLTDERIRLFKGKLGCGSCHSPYSRIKNNLVKPNLRGALCRTCHSK